MPTGALNPVVTVVTLNGLSVTMETEAGEPLSAVQTRAPSKAIPCGDSPTLVRNGAVAPRFLGSNSKRFAGVKAAGDKDPSSRHQHASSLGCAGPGFQKPSVTGPHSRDRAACEIRHP